MSAPPGREASPRAPFGAAAGLPGDGRVRYQHGMTKRGSDTEAGAGGGAPAAPGDAREERLSAALRANLARRKVQARARAGADEGYRDKAEEAGQA